VAAKVKEEDHARKKFAHDADTSSSKLRQDIEEQVIEEHVAEIA